MLPAGMTNISFVENIISHAFGASPFNMKQLMLRIGDKLTQDQVKRAMRDMERLHKYGKDQFRYHLRGK